MVMPKELSPSSILSVMPSELNKMSAAELITVITDAQQEEQDKIDAELAEQRDTVCVSQSGDTRGMLEQTWETRDGLGKLIGRRQTRWTYHDIPTDGVRDIIITETDGGGKVTLSRTIRHENGKVWVV